MSTFLLVFYSLLPLTFFSQNSLLWATYYGDVEFDYGYGVATDALGNVYMVGRSPSTSGIASGGFQNTYAGGEDAFLVKFDPTGNRLWATYYGGSGVEYGNSVAIDISGNIYIAGTTSSGSGIASGGFKNTMSGGADAFLVKFNSAGVRLWATYYGGSLGEYGTSVATDASGNVYLAGKTASTSGVATGGGLQTTYSGNYDAFLVKFNSSGNRLWATYYGGTLPEDRITVATDPLGNVYLGGTTSSSSNIASGGFKNSISGSADAFLVKFNASGGRLWATYYGDTGVLEYGNGIATDAFGNVYLAGETVSTSGIAVNGFQNVNGGLFDVFLVKFNSSGNRLWATYYGGPLSEEGGSITIDSKNNIFLAGDTYSNSGIASGGFQNNLVGTENAFIVQFDNNGNRLCATYFGQAHEEDMQIDTDGFGNVYLSGRVAATTGIASNGFQNVFGGGMYDAFLAKFSSCSNPISATASSPTSVCIGQCNGIATASTTGGVSPYSYRWNNNNTTQEISGLCAGIYTVTVVDALLATSIATTTITQTPEINAFANSNLTTIVPGDSSQLNATGGVTYQWTPAEGLSCITCANPIAKPTVSTTYCVIISDSNSCSDSVCIGINIEEACLTQIFIPNAFSPNGDGQNDILQIRGDCISLFTIFDRWGEKVFETTDITKGWDGTYKGEKLNSDIFTYQLKIISTEGEKKQKTGTVALIR